MYDNEGAQTLSSDRNTGVTTSNYGVPTIVVPTGPNPHGDATTIQIVGRAFDDGNVLSYGYALEQRLGSAGRVITDRAPRLEFDPGAPATNPTTTTPTQPVTSSPVTEPSTNTGLPVADPVPTADPAAGAAGGLRSAGRFNRRRATITLANTGAKDLKCRVTLKAKVRRRGKLRTVTIGTGRVTVGAGQAKAVAIPLSTAGKVAARTAGKVAARTSRRISATASYKLAAPGAPATVIGTKRVSLTG